MPLFTRETAREMAARSVAVRQERARRRAPAPLPAPASMGPDPFTAGLLVEVRALVLMVSDRLDEELERREIDAQLIDRLAAALVRVAELERVLAGRPLPGSHRPAAGRPGPAPRPVLHPLPDLEPAGDDHLAGLDGAQPPNSTAAAGPDPDPSTVPTPLP